MNTNEQNIQEQINQPDLQNNRQAEHASATVNTENAMHETSADHTAEAQSNISADEKNMTETTANTETVSHVSSQLPTDKNFLLLSKLGLPVLILLTLALCGQQFLFPRDFWFSEEVRYADIYMNMLSSGNFFSLTLNGHPYAESGPLYFILVWLLDTIPTVNMPQAFFGASILFAVLYIASTWLLAKGLGYSSKIAFLSGLIALSIFFVAGFTNYTRMDLLFAAFLNLSYLCFFRAWKKNSAPIWLIFAFLFLCCASLTASLTAFILPFAASVLFFLWTGKYKRINSADGILGFLLALLIIFVWFVYLYMQGNSEYISLIFEQQILHKITPLNTYDNDPLWFYFAGLPLVLFPWIFIILFGAWGSWIKNLPQAIKNRKEENAGAWLILLIITHIGIFSLFKDKNFASLVTVLPFFAILFAKTCTHFSVLRGKFFFTILSLLTILWGILFILVEFHAYILDYLPNLWNLPKEIPAFIEVATTNTSFGMTAMGGIFILLGTLLWYAGKKLSFGNLSLMYALGVIIALQPLNLLIAPQLGTVLSTKNHAYKMAEQHIQQNAVPASFKLYPDVFTYYYNEALNPEQYSKATITNISTIEELTDFLLSNDKAVIALSKEEFSKLPYKDEAIILDYKQWIENQYVILTLWNIAAHKPILTNNAENSPVQDNMINKNIVPNSEHLLNQTDRNSIIITPETETEQTPHHDPAQIPQTLPYLDKDNPIPNNLNQDPAQIPQTLPYLDKDHPISDNNTTDTTNQQTDTQKQIPTQL